MPGLAQILEVGRFSQARKREENAEKQKDEVIIQHRERPREHKTLTQRLCVFACAPCHAAGAVCKYMSHRDEDPWTLPEDIVFASCKMPKRKPDFLVFERQKIEDKVDGLDDDGDKKGRFWSKVDQDSGNWKMNGNVLYLYFPGKAEPETAIAKRSDREWSNPKIGLAINILEPQQNPSWFAPDVIREEFHDEENVAGKEFECPVCFFELYKFPQAIIKKHSKRVCCHYFHFECGLYLLKTLRKSKLGATCPVCGLPFAEVSQMPDICQQPRDWFATVDADFSGELSQLEIVEGLGATLPVTRKKLAKVINNNWHLWDPDGDDSISMNEFVMPDLGLRDWILAHFQAIATYAEEKRKHRPPQLDQSPIQWFAYWDADGSGTLDREELVRALIRTYSITPDGHPSLLHAHDMRESALALWKSLGYTPFASITLDEFVKPYGLMDNFVHNQMHCQYFGDDDCN